MFRPDSNRDRTDYSGILMPPDGYRLDRAVGTTYSLDLEALTAVAICLGLSEETDSKLMQNPIGMLNMYLMRKENIRNAFNSPMRPFVLATTSIGQEGLDFHNYCRVIMHWNLPSNPIDLEQREGRINRFKCLAIRQNVADKYGKADGITFKRDIWTEMFEAAKAEKQNDQSELVPFWCFGKNQSVKIERLVPMYPMSKDEVNYERLIKILSLYRLTLGQARQEELLEYLFKEFKETSGLKKLFIDLSPFSKGKEG